MLSKEEYIREHFPEVDFCGRPPGASILVQLRTPKKKYAGVIELVEDTKEFNAMNTQVGRLVAMGELAYRNRDTGRLWPEGVWAVQ